MVEHEAAIRGDQFGFGNVTRRYAIDFALG